MLFLFALFTQNHNTGLGKSNIIPPRHLPADRWSIVNHPDVRCISGSALAVLNRHFASRGSLVAIVPGRCVRKARNPTAC